MPDHELGISKKVLNSRSNMQALFSYTMFDSSGILLRPCS